MCKNILPYGLSKGKAFFCVHFLAFKAMCPSKYTLSYRSPRYSVVPGPWTSPRKFLTNSLFVILFFTCGLLRSTLSRISEWQRINTLSGIEKTKRKCYYPCIHVLDDQLLVNAFFRYQYLAKQTASDKGHKTDKKNLAAS